MVLGFMIWDHGLRIGGEGEAPLLETEEAEGADGAEEDEGVAKSHHSEGSSWICQVRV